MDHTGKGGDSTKPGVANVERLGEQVVFARHGLLVIPFSRCGPGALQIFFGECNPSCVLDPGKPSTVRQQRRA